MRYPSTPIRISLDGKVLAWCWNGQEVNGPAKLPVFRLKQPPKGGWRNGRILQIPFRSSFIQKHD